MQVDKDQILEMLRAQGDEQKAGQAEQDLPAQVDTEQHADVLANLGIDPADVVSKLGGGGGLGGLA